MNDFVHIEKDSAHAAREKAKAKELRKSRWWKDQLLKGICHYCRRHFPASELTMDHLLPISRMGKSTRGNCVPCCKECNNKKSCLTPAEMILNRIKKGAEE